MPPADDRGVRLRVVWRAPFPQETEAPRERSLTQLEKADLGGRFFRNTDFRGVDFSRADLRATWFVGVDLTGCDFSGADLRHTAFLDCDVRRAWFPGARLGGNVFKGSWFTGSRGLPRAVRAAIVRQGGFFLRTIPLDWW